MSDTQHGPVLEDPSTLVGTWALRREIEDRRAGEQHRIDGRLEITPDGPGRLRWRETGLWHRPEGDVEVHRELRVERDEGRDEGVDEAATWWVRFEDGRDFHPWRPGEEVVHPCAPDTYRGLVEGVDGVDGVEAAPEEWRITWVVTGPAKDHTLTTWLTRPGDHHAG